MTRSIKKAAINVLGIDLAKSSFQLHCVDESGKVACKKTFSRCEAAQRPNMRFVSIKEIEQQDLQSLHRMRSMAISSG